MNRNAPRGAHRAPGPAVIDYRGLARPVGRTVGGVAVLGAVTAGAAFTTGESARALTDTGALEAIRGSLPGSIKSTAKLADVKLRQGARGEAVRQLQSLLNHHGADIREDGIFGRATNKAVRSFQASNDLAVDGIVGPRTRAALNSDATATTKAAPAPSARAAHQPKLRRGDRGDAVRTLQSRLNAHGARIAEDGIFGRGTDRAVRSFQGSKELLVDGIVGPNTWRALGESSSAKPAPKPAPEKPSATPTLRQGDRGDAVRTLQTHLRERGASLRVDGIFGNGTDRAVRSLQRAAGIRVDGVVGRNTWKAVQNSSVRIDGGSASRDNEREKPPSRDSNGSAILAEAREHLGTRYVWGGSAPGGFDCSGLVFYVYNQTGIDVPRRSARGYVHNGTIIPRSEAQPGDLVAFTGNNYGHIGIYAGDGRIVDASTSRRQVVERQIWNAPHVFVTYR